MIPRPFWLLLSALITVGCGEDNEAQTRADKTAYGEAKSARPALAPAPPADAAGQAALPNAPPTGVPRKIIYSAEVELIVENFAQAERELVRLVHESKAYLSESSLQGSTGEHRYGTWKARVPIEKFEEFLDAIVKLGELQRRQLTSQDVTEEYYDLDARIKNKKVEEARLLKHLEESTGKLKDILDVEKEISRVREEVERQQGRLQLLANLTSLTTVTITLHERQNYIPPAAPTFKTRLGRTFQASVDALREFGEAVVLFAVAIAPWLPVIAVLIGIIWLLARRWRRRRGRDQVQLVVES
ncbi:MAG TPA: DUF4349 domain-containing protein [Isosphaeraceae bacterium]|nr:DUF4349 domain-containing protein [Isosphaeraceae bacterium]